jgi:hypothetical protein
MAIRFMEKMMEIRDLPEGDDPITTNEMTRLLVKALPEKDRPEARRILADEILAAQLGRQADDPAPKRLAELVYEDLIELPRMCRPKSGFRL